MHLATSQFVSYANVASLLSSGSGSSIDRNDIAELIRRGGPTIVYQPIAHVDTGQLLGVEALSRFKHGGANQWFAAAAAVGLTADLEMAAARNALQAVPERVRQTIGWEMVGVNLSPETLLDPRFDELLGDEIGSHVVLELDTPGDTADWGVIRSCLDRVRDLGARIGLNAVTCDPSGQFERLVSAAPEVLKLATDYTSTLLNQRGQRGLAEEFLLDCQKRGVFVVGVGVEQPQDLDVLRDLGVDAAQGYLIGRPQPVEQFPPSRPLFMSIDEILMAKAS
jgi:EAL domain-containing protein (putative c-di-GMP-specific phosphodiesterase class I)